MKTKEELLKEISKAKEAQTKFKGALKDKFAELEKKLTIELEQLESAKEKTISEEIETVAEDKPKKEKKSKKDLEKKEKPSKPKKEKKNFNVIIEGEEVEITPENCEKILNEWNSRKAKVKENADKKKKTNPITRAVETVKDSITTITNAVEKIVEEKVDKGISAKEEKTTISEINQIKELLKQLAILLSKFADKNVNIKEALSTLENSISTIKE